MMSSEKEGATGRCFRCGFIRNADYDTEFDFQFAGVFKAGRGKTEGGDCANSCIIMKPAVAIGNRCNGA